MKQEHFSASMSRLRVDSSRDEESFIQLQYLPPRQRNCGVIDQILDTNDDERTKEMQNCATTIGKNTGARGFINFITRAAGFSGR